MFQSSLPHALRVLCPFGRNPVYDGMAANLNSAAILEDTGKHALTT